MRKKVAVQAAAAAEKRFDEVSADLRAAGMHVEQEMRMLGHFVGLVDEEKVEELRKIAGVANVKVTGNEGESDPDEYSV